MTTSGHFLRCIPLAVAICVSACSVSHPPAGVRPSPGLHTSSTSPKAGRLVHEYASTPLPAMADSTARCISAATAPSLPSGEVYHECLSDSELLLNSKKPKLKRDEDTLTSAILLVYAAYAFQRAHSGDEYSRSSARVAITAQEARRMIAEARRRLTDLSYNGATQDVRARARAVRNCLIDVDGPCLDKWAKVQ
jgi:hypothetical protein